MSESWTHIPFEFPNPMPFVLPGMDGGLVDELVGFSGELVGAVADAGLGTLTELVGGTHSMLVELFQQASDTAFGQAA